MTTLNDLLELDGAGAWGQLNEPGLPDRAIVRADQWLAALQNLRDWCMWKRVSIHAATLGLEPLADAIAHGEVVPEDALDVFTRSYDEWWFESVTDREPVLRDFLGERHEERIRRFQDLDEHYLRLTRELAVARLVSQIPRGRFADSSEPGILRREAQKKMRQKAVRELLRELSGLLPRLKPCFLMSPLSVAQYLDPTVTDFDLIVFDEASQIPPWDAVGALSRGRNAVIVGDPKQLPPTSFFEKLSPDDEPEEDQVDDVESILDECIAASLPHLTLDWHYRSCHENLIAFSNHRYYNDRLLLFPAACREGAGVFHHHVPGGVYDRSRTRANAAEADAIVADVARRLASPDSAHLSIGIVTFSLAQQVLIEDRLDDMLRRKPALEPYFTDAAPEPVFVKNLENVQGDERDVILLSVCYGPDSQGTVSMNFGPLNREGGWRRLNVAITRARRELHVFSTLRPEQIDLRRSNSEGVLNLKQFLEYAMRGTVALGAVARSPDNALTGSLMAELARCIESHGWTARHRVGYGGYCVDLAVVHPERPEQLVLGIECDGDGYKAFKTARDREKLRQDVLQSLGWELTRIWGSEWWRNPDREAERLDTEIRCAVSTRADWHLPPGRNAHLHLDDTGIGSVTSGATESTKAPVSESDPPPDDPHAAAPRHRPAVLPRHSKPADAFYDTGNTLEVAADIETVVNVEGPASTDTVMHRILAAWNVPQANARARSRFAEILRRCRVAIEEEPDGQGFILPSGQSLCEYRSYRIPEAGVSIRQPEEIPLVEIANAARAVLQQQVGLPTLDLARETARVMGFLRLTRKVQIRFLSGIQILLDHGEAESPG
jgi:very-short-patch-repair endonuclease